MTYHQKIGALIFGAILIVVGLVLLLSKEKEISLPTPEVPTEIKITEEPVVEVKSSVTIGNSVEGRAIESYTFGQGKTTLLFVGGIHGGYEWNSSLLAYEFIAKLESGEITVPESITVKIIPNLNPDGLYSVIKKEGVFTAEEIPDNDSATTGAGRFNANNVDLNRNFACKWKPESSWRGKVVSAGTAAFSEPEAAALRDYVLAVNPAAVVFWHSQANTVYASECEDGVLPETLTLMNSYATAGKYKSVTAFDAYPISGDAEGWLASIKIPAITVELETRTSSELKRNVAGVEKIFSLYSTPK
jgi:hypothetical protein